MNGKGADSVGSRLWFGFFEAIIGQDAFFGQSSTMSQ